MTTLTDTDKRPIDQELTRQVIGAFYDVYNTLGHGFLEAVYSEALGIELEERGIGFEREARLEVRYKESVVGVYRADFLVEESVVLELKATPTLVAAHRAPLLNCLKASRRHVGLLLHFGSEPDVRRVVVR